MQAATVQAPPRPLVMIDNTFLGPAFQHPLSLGADLSIYSATKYLGGFSDIIGGVVLGKDPALMHKIRSKRSLFGNICSRMNAGFSTRACPRFTCV
jgi:methionine-gamma-lyase